MEIRFSRYNSFFTDPWSLDPNVHCISIDDQLDIRAGRFDAHVRLFYSLAPNVYINRSPYSRSARQIDVYDPLTDTTHHHEVNPGDFSYSVSTSEPDLAADEIKFLDELYYKHGIKTAGKRTGRYD